MKSKEEIINEMFNECGGNIFHTIHDVKIISSFMERYAIQKQIEVLNDIENYINALDNGLFIGWNASEKGGYTTATHSIKMKISELHLNNLT